MKAVPTVYFFYFCRWQRLGLKANLVAPVSEIFVPTDCKVSTLPTTYLVRLHRLYSLALGPS